MRWAPPSSARRSSTLVPPRLRHSPRVPSTSPTSDPIRRSIRTSSRPGHPLGLLRVSRPAGQHWASDQETPPPKTQKKPPIPPPQDLKGATVATPQLGNTQDVSARTWFAAQGLKTDTQGGGDVHITPTENAQAFTLFQQGKLDAAWVPEPWVSRFTLEAGAHVLVDEASLWPDGAFPTTVLLVSNAYPQKPPDTVTKLLQGHVQSVTWLTAHPGEAPGVVNAGLQAAAGKPLPDAGIAQTIKANQLNKHPKPTPTYTPLPHT